MKLDIKTDDGIVTLERVAYFEVGTDDVYIERDGEFETIDGELYGGSA